MTYAINPTASSAAPAAAPKNSSPVAPNALDGDDFMLLLLAQLRHQNPLEPMNEKEMMGQIAQLNSLQELQKINSNLESSLKSTRLSEAAGLIGKQVCFSINGANGRGAVTGVSLEGSEVMLWLGNGRVPMSSVTAVFQPALPSTDSQSGA
jgi:flagellar basal-body rod modification protein FlgD